MAALECEALSAAASGEMYLMTSRRPHSINQHTSWCLFEMQPSVSLAPFASTSSLLLLLMTALESSWFFHRSTAAWHRSSNRIEAFMILVRQHERARVVIVLVVGKVTSAITTRLDTTRPRSLAPQASMMMPLMITSVAMVVARALRRRWLVGDGGRLVRSTVPSTSSRSSVATLVLREISDFLMDDRIDR